MGKHFYTDFWEMVLPVIIDALNENKSKEGVLPQEEFDKRGIRNDGFTFKIELENDSCVKISNSAVARDLCDVVLGSYKARKLLKNKRVILRMGVGFRFQVLIDELVKSGGVAKHEVPVATPPKVVSDVRPVSAVASGSVGSFPPLVDDNSEILILGTAPGKESLAKGEYYANKSNAMWKIFADLYNNGKSFCSYEEKVECLKRNHIALWDVFHSCDRVSSLDSDIKNEIPNDIQAFLNQHPNIRRIITNGGKAAKAVMKMRLSVECLPAGSTSSLNSTRYDVKLKEWRELLTDCH